VSCVAPPAALPSHTPTTPRLKLSPLAITILPSCLLFFQVETRSGSIEDHIVQLGAFLKKGRDEVTAIGRKAKRIRGSTGAQKRDKKQQITNIDTQIDAIKEEIQKEEEEIYECELMLANGEVSKFITPQLASIQY
jgi:hypothetical protein